MICLKKCVMNINQMKESLCLLGKGSIPQRQAELQASLDFIDRKQQCCRDVLDKRIPYRSILILSTGADEGTSCL